MLANLRCPRGGSPGACMQGDESVIGFVWVEAKQLPYTRRRLSLAVCVNV